MTQDSYVQHCILQLLKLLRVPKEGEVSLESETAPVAATYSVTWNSFYIAIC